MSEVYRIAIHRRSTSIALSPRLSRDVLCGRWQHFHSDQANAVLNWGLTRSHISYIQQLNPHNRQLLIKYPSTQSQSRRKAGRTCSSASTGTCAAITACLHADPRKSSLADNTLALNTKPRQAPSGLLQAPTEVTQGRLDLCPLVCCTRTEPSGNATGRGPSSREVFLRKPCCKARTCLQQRSGATTPGASRPELHQS